MSAYYNYMSNDDIYHALKEDILTLKLKPGQMISENEVSRIYNVSRTPVKTAFLRLKGEKYVEIIPQKGSYVTLLDMEYIKDIIYMRCILETEIIGSIIDGGDYAALLDQLQANLENQLELIETPGVTPSLFYQVDSQFHYLMFQHVGRTKMWDVIQECQVYYTRFRILDTLTTARYQQLYTEHKQILEALRAGDKDSIRRVIHDHLHGNLRILGDRINGEFKEYFVQHNEL